MRLPKTDIIATCLVAAAGLLYLLWAVGSTLPGMSSSRATGVAGTVMTPLPVPTLVNRAGARPGASD
jgi:hypothetical protein